MQIKKVLVTMTAAAGMLMASGAVANADTVTVKAGDTISSIAQANQVSISSIVSANKLANINLIYVGQKLEVGTPTNSQVTQQVQPQVQQQPQVNSQQAPQAVHSQTQPQQVSPSQTHQAAVQQTAQTVSTQTTTSATTSTSSNSSEASAKAAIAARESGGSYTATNGQYYGKYQLGKSMLNGDLSAANQEKAADNYVSGRYGSWSNALQHSNQYGWY